MSEILPQAAVSVIRRSADIGKLAAALAKAQAKFTHPKKDKKAVIKSDKGAYEYMYSDLADLTDVVRGPLAENELAVVQVPGTRTDGGALVLDVVTLLIHSSGEWLESTLTWGVADRKPQTLGGLITYLRRYALGAMLGVTAETDDDGAIAQAAAEQAAQRGGGNQQQRGQPSGQRQQGNPQQRGSSPQGRQAGAPSGGKPALYTGTDEQKRRLNDALNARSIPREMRKAIADKMQGKAEGDGDVLAAVINEVQEEAKRAKEVAGSDAAASGAAQKREEPSGAPVGEGARLQPGGGDQASSNQNG